MLSLLCGSVYYTAYYSAPFSDGQAPHYPAILGFYQFSFPRLDGSWLQMASCPLSTGSPCPSHETLP